MKIKVHKDGERVNKVLIGMITNEQVLGRISSRWDRKMFNSDWANTVGNLCVDFYQKYNKAPNKGIQTLFQTWEEQNEDKDTSKLVESFLSNLSDEYERSEELNTKHIINIAENLFTDVRIQRLRDTLDTCLEARERDKAHKAIVEFSKLELEQGHGCNLFQDQEAIKAALSPKRNEPVIEYPGAVGQFFGSRLARGCFVGITAPEKFGKTRWLVDMAYRAMLQRRRVAFFAVGDDTLDEFNERVLVRAAAHPYYNHSGEWPYEVDYPIKVKRPQEGENSAYVKFKTKTFSSPLSYKKGVEAAERVMQEKVKSKRSFFQVSAHPSLSININGIWSIIQGWIVAGWVPDVVLIDYADNLAPPLGTSSKDEQAQIDTTWKQMRAISQQPFQPLVITASQAKADSYLRKTMDRRDTSRDKRKLAHVTAMMGINKNEEESDKQICRLNWIVGRKGHTSASRCVHCAGCLALENPCVLSCW